MTDDPPDAPWGHAPAFLAAVDEARIAARSQRAVLLLGPTGCGKSLLARWIHAVGRRAARPPVVVSCPTIPDGVAERELFGAVRGAFTGADQTTDGLLHAADGGTLYLEEVGDLSPSVQAKLLVFLESGRYRRLGETRERQSDVRIIAATHRELLQGSGFRADLYHRLAGFPIRLPSLAERVEDLPGLAERLVRRAAAEEHLRPLPLSADAVAALIAHPWPGNVRELDQRLARALLRAHDVGSTHLTAAHLGLDAPDGTQPGTLARQVSAFERWLVHRALADQHGNVSATARRLGLSRNRLYERLRKTGHRSGHHATGGR